jgi:hypothetical protein
VFPDRLAILPVSIALAISSFVGSCPLVLLLMFRCIFLFRLPVGPFLSSCTFELLSYLVSETYSATILPPTTGVFRSMLLS